MTDPATQTDANDWTVWQGLIGTKGSPKRDSDVTTGYWRLPNGVAGTAIPIATWAEGKFWIASVNGREIDADSGEEWLEFVASRWPKLNAVNMADYEAALANGVWPDGTPVKKERGGPGDNQPPEDTPPEEVLATKLADLESEVLAWLKSLGWKPESQNWVPPTKEAADRTVVYQTRFQEIESEAERLRVAESDPLHKAWKASIEKWKPVVSGAKVLKDQIYEFGQAYVRAENTRLREEARIENERIAEEARKNAASTPSETAAPAPKPAPVVPQSVSIGATRKMTEHKTPAHVEVGNLADFVAYLAAEMDPDLQACALKVARAKVKANVAHLPGVLVDGQPRLNPPKA